MKRLPMIVVALMIFISACEIMPRNSLPDCQQQCKDSKKKQACLEFCDCIHNRDEPLDSCLDKYNKAPEDSVQTNK
jgi:hypothetical protein